MACLAADSLRLYLSHVVSIFGGMIGNNTSLYRSSLSMNSLVSNYWGRLVNCILVRGQSVSTLSEGEILCAFNELKSRRPELRYSVKAVGEKHGAMFQQGDKIQEIRIAKSLDAMVSVELLINFQATVRLSIKDFTSISYSLPTIDLQETLENLECFVDDFPKNFERFENALVENEKKAKIEAMAKVSIKAAIEQLLASTHYEWELIETDKFYSLRVGLGNNVVSMTLNDKNFARRIPVLLDALRQVENLVEALPFPMDIAMGKKFVKF